jgi:hypothetical protein
MRHIVIITAAMAMAGAALAQQSSTGQSSGGPLVQRGPTATGSIVIPAEKRTVIRQRFVAPPVPRSASGSSLARPCRPRWSWRQSLRR